jgi:hypothetical protein
MSSIPPDTVSRFREPAYTGENRCIPCTAVNLVIAVVASALLALVSLPVGGFVFVLSVGTIYLRGYLVPGTPRLTKRYFPDWVLRRFDKEITASDTPTEKETQIDPETALVRAGALTECAERDDLCLDESFRDELYDQIAVERSGEAPGSEIAAVLDVDAARLSVDDHGGAFVARVDEVPIGQWPSRAAFLADSAAATLFARRNPEWERRSPAARSQLLAGLRLFLDTCPACTGPLTFGEETVESCCRSTDVAAVTCRDCDARLFEIEHTPETL